MLNNWQSERSFGETFSVLRTKTFLVRSIGEPVRSVVSTERTAATCKIPKGYLRHCLAYFMQLRICRARVRELLLPEKPLAEAVRDKKPSRIRSRCTRIPWEKTHHDARARPSRTLWTMISATWQLLTKSRRLVERRLRISLWRLMIPSEYSNV